MVLPDIGGRRPRKLLKRLLGWTGELTGSGGLVDAIFPAPLSTSTSIGGPPSFFTTPGTSATRFSPRSV